MLFYLLTLIHDADAKNCKKGQPCGASCIAWSKTCHSGSSSRSSSHAPPVRPVYPPAEPVPSMLVPFSVAVPPTYVVRRADRQGVVLADGENVFNCLPVLALCVVPPVGAEVVSNREIVAAGGTMSAPVLTFVVGDVAQSCTVARCVAGESTPVERLDFREPEEEFEFEGDH
jgi:hypothetical protein